MVPEVFALVLSGVGIGLIVAAPIGPVNLICIRRTLIFGRLNGFLSGTGAALGDGVFAIVVAFGLTAISGFIDGFQAWLLSIGGLLLIGTGIHTFYANPEAFARTATAPATARKRRGSLIAAIVSTFFLTITNPATMFGFVALFSGIGVGGEEMDMTTLHAALLVAAVVAGSALWWAIVTFITGRFRARFSVGTLQIINRVSGVAIGSFGIFVLGRVILSLIL